MAQMKIAVLINGMPMPDIVEIAADGSGFWFSMETAEKKVRELASSANRFSDHYSLNLAQKKFFDSLEAK